jgi:hypothetical protein
MAVFLMLMKAPTTMTTTIVVTVEWMAGIVCYKWDDDTSWGALSFYWDQKKMVEAETWCALSIHKTH